MGLQLGLGRNFQFCLTPFACNAMDDGPHPRRLWSRNMGPWNVLLTELHIPGRSYQTHLMPIWCVSTTKRKEVKASSLAISLWHSMSLCNFLLVPPF